MYPQARWKHASTIHKDCLYIMGGCSWTKPLKDLWSLDLSKISNHFKNYEKLYNFWINLDYIKEFEIDCLWTNLSDYTGHILPLQSHSIVGYKDFLYIFGGSFTNDAKDCPLWIYSIEKRSMSKISMKVPSKSGTPVPRRYHSCCSYRNSMIIFGGFADIKGSLGDFWAFNFDLQKWSLIWTQGVVLTESGKKMMKTGPRARHNHQSVIHQNKIWIYGGMNGLITCDDMWCWDFSECYWTKILFRSSPLDLINVVETKLKGTWLFYGYNEVKSKTEKWMFSFKLNKWFQHTIISLPELSANASMVAVLKTFSTRPTTLSKFSQNINQFPNRHNRISPMTNCPTFNCLDKIHVNESAISNTKSCDNILFDIINDSTGNDEKLESRVNCDASSFNNIDLLETSFINPQVDTVTKSEFLVIVGNNIDNHTFEKFLQIKICIL